MKYRTGGAWTKDLVLSVVGQAAAIGTYFWGKRRANRPRPQEEWLPLVVDPIVDREVFDVVQRLRQSRDPASSPGRGVAKPHLLTGLLRCAKCGASYQLETSGKKVEGGVYRYCYYICRNALRAGVEVCSGFRIPTEALDEVVLAHIADSTCSMERARQLAKRRKWTARPEEITRTWREVVTSHPTVSRSYLMHLVERIEVDGVQITIVPRRKSQSRGQDSFTALLERAVLRRRPWRDPFRAGEWIHLIDGLGRRLPA